MQKKEIFIITIHLIRRYRKRSIFIVEINVLAVSTTAAVATPATAPKDGGVLHRKSLIIGVEIDKMTIS
jgi:hypothetical protein